MKSKLYKCRFNDIAAAGIEGEYVAQSPELAAEYFCEDEVDVHCSDEILVDVEAEDGTVYTVTVEAQVKPSFQSKKN